MWLLKRRVALFLMLLLLESHSCLAPRQLPEGRALTADVYAGPHQTLHACRDRRAYRLTGTWEPLDVHAHMRAFMPLSCCRNGAVYARVLTSTPPLARCCWCTYTGTHASWSRFGWTPSYMYAYTHARAAAAKRHPCTANIHGHTHTVALTPA